MKKTIAIIILIIICLGLGGYIAYDKLYAEKEVEPEPTEEKEKLIEGYEYDFVDEKCGLQEICSAEKKISYNGKNHIIKVEVSDEENERNEFVKRNHKVYIDDKLVLTSSDDGMATKEEEKRMFVHLYIFNGKYLGILMPVFGDKIGYKLNLFNDDILVEKDIDIFPNYEFFNDYETNERIDRMPIFDGENFDYYRLKCIYPEVIEGVDYSMAEKVRLTFDGKNSKIEVLEELKVKNEGAVHTNIQCD